MNQRKSEFIRIGAHMEGPLASQLLAGGRLNSRTGTVIPIRIGEKNWRNNAQAWYTD